MKKLFLTTLPLVVIGLIAASGCTDKSSSGPTANPTIPVGEKAQGTETQNGGYGVALPPPQSRIVSLDLYLRGSHESPYLSSEHALSLDETQIKLLHTHLDPIAGTAVTDIVARKLAHAREVAKDLRTGLDLDFIIQNINEFQWLRMTDTECLDIRDDDSPIKEKVQLAYRQGFYVRFCRDFEALDEANKAALITHEIVYASLKSKSATREFVGLVFNSDFQSMTEKTKDEFKKVARRLIDDSRSPLLNGSIEIQQVLPIENSLAERLEKQLKQKPCFGFGLTGNGRRAAIWGIALDASCSSGLVNSRSLLIVQPDSNTIQGPSKTVIGEMIASTATLVSLCSKNYSNVCRLENTDGYWRLIYGLPDVEDKSLVGAVRSGDEFEVKRLLSMGADPNEIDPLTKNPLLLEAYLRQNSMMDGIIDRLIVAGADPNIRHYGNSLAFKALTDSRIAVAVSLIKSPLFNKNDTQLVLQTIELRHNFLLRLLVDAGVSLNPSRPLDTAPIIQAAYAQDLEAVKILLSSTRIDINVFGYPDNRALDFMGACAALAWAARRGNLPIVAELINMKADVNTKCEIFGTTPLMFATTLQSEAMVDLLLSAGANIQAKDTADRAALDYARRIQPPTETSMRIMQKLENALLK